MNLSAYIFGRFFEKYTQYPSDYTDEIFSKFLSISFGEDAVVTHRDGNLMYYGYIRRLSNGDALGICAVLNDLMVMDPVSLFPIFENIFSKVVIAGNLVKLSDDGSLVPAVRLLTDYMYESESLTSLIVYEFKNADITFGKLPPLSFAIDVNEVKWISAIDDNIAEARANSISYAYSVISRNESINTNSLNDYISTVKRLNREKKRALEELRQLTIAHERLKRAKKQVQLVVILLLGIAVCGIILFFLYDNLSTAKGELDDTKQALSYAHTTIEVQNKEIEENKKSLEVLTNNYNKEVENRKKIQEELNQNNERISNSFPIIITDVQVANERKNGSVVNSFGTRLYSKNTYYLTPKITYYGFVSEEITLNVKLYTPKGLSTSTYSTFSYTSSLQTYKGVNTREIGGWGTDYAGNWGAGKYTFEFWYRDYCLGSYSFIIY